MHGKGLGIWIPSVSRPKTGMSHVDKRDEPKQFWSVELLWHEDTRMVFQLPGMPNNVVSELTKVSTYWTYLWLY
ncbi:side tail fiber assembly protein [Salmonella phage 41]|nr:side tail fiber assembly protein [Salmonella phage 41]